MIKAEELRIGNYLDWEGEVLKVDSNDFNNLGKAEPIPLNEEWLLKFGFAKNITTNLYSFKDWQVYIDSDRIVFRIIGMSLATIKHVHQLQNLYFALTQEELKYTYQKNNN